MTGVREPADLYGPLLTAVHEAHLFEDSKTFADAEPKRSITDIMRAFQSLQPGDNDALRSFVLENFEIPPIAPHRPKLQPWKAGETGVREHIQHLWDRLSRSGQHHETAGSSLIPLPRPYVVPGGRFGEIYYWDSFFTMLGLLESGRAAMVENMVDNFAYLIERLGFIPNGNRTYFCSRSQPPLFAFMVDLIGGDTAGRYLSEMEAEYAFWMQGEGFGTTQRRVAHLAGYTLNRYWDDDARPRTESYREDVRLARQSSRRAEDLFRDLRAACESGWDFSSRWLTDPHDLATIRTTSLVPVDLNALLYGVEERLARHCDAKGLTDKAVDYRAKASARQEAIQNVLFNEDQGIYTDVNLDGSLSNGLTLAGVVPLFTGCASTTQASAVARTLEDRFLAPGGWRTTLQSTGQQWDKPNGWAPLQWITFHGLKRYGFHDLAAYGARRWVDNNLHVFEERGYLLEKYDVEQVGKVPTGGEYAVQHGFGWTNGVLLSLMCELSER